MANYKKIITILSNTEDMGKVQLKNVEVKNLPYPEADNFMKQGWLVYRQSFNVDFVIMNCNILGLLSQCLFRLLPLGNKSKLISLDTVLQIPDSFKSKITIFIKSLLFKKVDLYIEYFKDLKGYKKYYRMNPQKFRYTPFKINRYEDVLEKIENNEISDEKYIFCGGNTRRDFETLIKVAEQVDYPFVIVTMGNNVIDEHDSNLNENNVPGNVTVIRHDGSNSFLDYIAKSRMVALPIKSNSISASGIGVYIACMALKKCVVISSGPSVNDIISDQAIVVPPEDVEALKNAIVTAYEDEKLRNVYAQRGQDYALSLAGEDRLYKSVLEIIIKEYECA